MLSACALLLVLAADPIPKDPGPGTPRKVNPLAPSLPELTDKEEAELDKIIDKFIQADTGKMTGPEAKSAIDAFKSLGPEATFALIRGFNKSAHIDHSCPALTIGRKLTSILRRTEDMSLLQFAKENIGVGVKKTRHTDVIRDVKMGCSQRITYLKNMPPAELKGVPPAK
jgi:hypothetical protein